MFETQRCFIHNLSESDYTDVRKLYLHHAVRKFLGGTLDQHAIRPVFDDMLHAGDDAFYWVVREKQTGGFLGLISLDPHHEGVCLELSYQFLTDSWGKGYAAETVRLIIHFALHELHLPRIIAETQIANVPSRRLLERAGMKLERTITRFGARQAIYVIGKD